QRAEADGLAVPVDRHRGVAFHDHDEGVGGVALLDDVVSGVEADELSGLGKLRDLLGLQRAEKGALPERRLDALLQVVPIGQDFHPSTSVFRQTKYLKIA